MYELETTTEQIITEKIVIGGKLFNLFKDWIKTTKLSNQKIKILKLCEEQGETYLSLEELHKKTLLSLPLLSYHINGNLKSTGLYEAEIIEKKSIGKGRTGIRLTEFGLIVLEVISKK